MVPTKHNQHGTTEWYRLSQYDTERQLNADQHHGLSVTEAAHRLHRYGRNEIREGRKSNLLIIFVTQFTDFMILVLIAAAIISGLIGDAIDTFVILAIIVLNGLIGFIQEYRAERAIAALKRMTALHAHVLRNGQSSVIPAAELVPGDVVMIEAGNAVPADVRLTESAQLKIDESAITGESQPVEKIDSVIDEPELALGDRRNMAYKGTLVTYGRGKGLVVATGMRSELGRIAELIRGAEEVKTPLQRRLKKFSRKLSAVVLLICAIVFVAGLFRGEPLMLMLLTAISLAVAAIPEALPAIISISLAFGARKMADNNALVRRLPAVETLGSVTFICSDKTGTLTENRMRVEELYANGQLLKQLDSALGDNEPWRSLIQALAISNDARESSAGGIIGDPTEVALFEAGRKAGIDKHRLEQTLPRVEEIPFDPERARMTTIHRSEQGVVAFTKGASEQVLPLCRDFHSGDERIPVDHDALTRIADRMAGDGLRVLAIAMRRWPQLPDDLTPTNIERDLTLLGFVGLMDPPRVEAREAVQLCQTAGITPVMITGDHPATARAIAQRLGIIEDGAEVLTGPELDRMDLAEFEEHVERVRVYARVAPEQKIKLVRALQDKGEFVAMTGDGVNDAPALKRADIGVAMGIAGTDVAKEAGHMILLDDNFATIVKAVREGRRIFDNIRKFIKYAMTCNSAEIWTIFFAPFLGLPMPLLPIHILWINLVTDGLPGLALVTEKGERGIMRRPPRPPSESIFAGGMWQHIVWVGLLMMAVTLTAQGWAIRTGHGHWQTMVFTVLALSQLGHVMAIRSERDSLFRQGLLSNTPMLIVIVFTVGLQLSTIYVPMLNTVFKTEPLTLPELVTCFALSSIVFIGVELEKWAYRRGWLYSAPTKESAASQQGGDS
jgi:Ca2+-transporting ATPase